MKDEIKEILEDLLFITTLPNVSVKLSEEKLNQLKDYITNLQEENDILKRDIEAMKHNLDKLKELKGSDR
jgi:predicted RNase H-like nuclease (RuvC/YqgF family)